MARTNLRAEVRRPGGGCRPGTGSPPFTRVWSPGNLEVDLIGTLQLQHFAGVVRGCHLKTQPLDDLTCLQDLICVGCGHLAGPEPERILQSNADVANVKTLKLKRK